jgi:hypothetical protein
MILIKKNGVIEVTGRKVNISSRLGGINLETKGEMRIQADWGFTGNSNLTVRR